jgi:hypothetical protein
MAIGAGYWVLRLEPVGRSKGPFLTDWTERSGVAPGPAFKLGSESVSVTTQNRLDRVNHIVVTSKLRTENHPIAGPRDIKRDLQPAARVKYDGS